MCDVCSDLLSLLKSHDKRQEERGGLYLSKEECFQVTQYVHCWHQQRQCMCCYKDLQNFERFNNIVQIVLNKAIWLIRTLPSHNEKDSPEHGDSPDKGVSQKDGDSSEGDSPEDWTVEDKDGLFQFVTNVFLTNFPLYHAFKQMMQCSLEELSQQEAAALNNYCELTDPDIPVHLLRNVCFFCDSNGISAIAHCFDKSSPEILPYTVAHTLINIVINLRFWMNIGCVIQNICPLRTYISRYMCRLSDRDLRMAGTRNMTDLLWTAFKEPLDTHISFDKEALRLAFKYFTCTTLTIRLGGITQINNFINMYNELANSDSIIEAESIGNELADWLIQNKIIEHLFGPNLHVEIVKQSQIILNFLAMEARITTEHVDCMWAAAQLKHCSKQVLDILIPLIKHMEVWPVQHLLKLVSNLEAPQQNEQTLYLSSALIKYLWNAARGQHVTSLQHEQARFITKECLKDNKVEMAFSSSEHSLTDDDLEEGEIRLKGNRIIHRQGHRIQGVKVNLGHDSDEMSDDDSSLCDEMTSDDSSDVIHHGNTRFEPANQHTDNEVEKHIKVVHYGHEDSEYSSDDEERRHVYVDSDEMEHIVTSHATRHARQHAKCHQPHVKRKRRPLKLPARVKRGPIKRKGITSRPMGDKRGVKVAGVVAPDKTGSEKPEVDKSGLADKKQENVDEKIEKEDKPEIVNEKVENMENESKKSEKTEKKSDISGESSVNVEDDTNQTPETKPDKSDRDKIEVDKSEIETGEGETSADKSESVADKKESVADKSETAVDKSAADKSETAADKSETAADKSETAAGKSEIAAEKSEATADKSENKASKVAGDKTENTAEKAGVAADKAKTAADKAKTAAAKTKNAVDKDKTSQSETISDKSEISPDKTVDNKPGKSIEVPMETDPVYTEDVKVTDSDHPEAMSDVPDMGSDPPEPGDAPLEDPFLHFHHKDMEAGHMSGFMPSSVKCNVSDLEGILSPDNDSCNSSRISAKSQKNMADFEGEDVLSEDELHNVYHGNHAGCHGDHCHQLASLASLHQGVRAPAGRGQQQVETNVSFEDVCKPGNTLLWDLLQDKNISKLPEGLASEAEKVLTSLVCFSTDRRIRCSFIEACIDNVTNHRSTVISLRLLPKLLSSFQPYRGSGLDTHAVTMWAEKELNMMRHFFNNLICYTKAYQCGHKSTTTLFSHIEEVQVRLQFLTCIFSNQGSPDTFSLTVNQVDTLWNCLSTDPECSDECFNWFLNQAKSKEHHALDLDSFKHVFLYKMPLVEPENMSIVGLNLFTQLCNLARFANAAREQPLPDEQICGMDQSWGIALRAQNTDVSLTAIHYLNNYYINYRGSGMEKEEEFVQRCMDSLVKASSKLDQHPENSLLIIQRGLILLTNHLESFRKRYAFHLRNWQINGRGIVSHQKSLQDKQSNPIRILLQPASTPPDKTTIEMLSCDLVGELRAEVTRWWENVQKQHRAQLQQQTTEGEGDQKGSILTPILGAMLGDGPIRMITQGQELTVDMDEKTLSEMQFKDSQLVYVSLGASRQPRKQDGSVAPSFLPSPPIDKIPMTLLIEEPHFDRLFQLLKQLSDFRHRKKMDQQVDYNVQTKAKVLSRKVWDLLMMLPTNPDMLSAYKNIGSTQETTKWEELLDPLNPLKLMYSLQIVESLSRPPKHKRRSLLMSRSDSRAGSVESEMSIDDVELPEERWSKQFVSKSGLKHLFATFLSGRLQFKEGDTWNEWNQDCLAYLLKLMTQFAVIQADMDQDEVFDIQESPRKKMRRLRANERVFIPRLSKSILSVIEAENVVNILMTILFDAALPGRDANQWPSASWGRVEVVHYAVSFLVSLAYSIEEVLPILCSHGNFGNWLRRLTLEAPEPAVRQESCQGLYKLCLGKTADGHTGYPFLMPVLANMLTFLSEAEKMKPAKKTCQEEKEPYGPGCRDYFWLLCRLVDNITSDDAISSWDNDNSHVDLNTLATHVSQCLLSRGYIEKRQDTIEDDGLIGLLHLSAAIMKHSPPYRTSAEGQAFLNEVFQFLFALPSPEKRYLPKCKSINARSAAYDLLVEMVKGNIENYSILHSKVLAQHVKESHAVYGWDTWPHEDERSKCGYVGLTNLGATCYMATCMQHLYMIPEARQSVLEAPCGDKNKYQLMLVELKKMFAYLLESERKSYDPRNFCKVYTMDHQPLNTGEQKDMTEFFTDLISKLEETGPQLRQLVKTLFGGVLTNNVVSLDCPHVSRTKEEFYTVRCQVADMKNLYDSLDEVTVKDMLEGDNMYTCSKCQKKVRAEKRACFKKLPKILCFNTMRYTFNMVTMMKEKVNTHFSFPLRLDMHNYMETSLIKKERLQADDSERSDSESEAESGDSYLYELIGVTVHTGTAEGGHYYSFIRDKLNKNDMGNDKWYLFNDAEVKQFDPTQIASECFGGEMTSKTYDSMAEKFMDFSFEKTNSAYMLFYERIECKSCCHGDKTGDHGDKKCDCVDNSRDVTNDEPMTDEKPPQFKFELSKELADWIWRDNMQFLQDKNIFEHTYFNFMWQMCSYIPTTFPKTERDPRLPLMVAKLSASFLLETFIHAREKPNMLQWIEMLTKIYNSCQPACEWFLDAMGGNDWWPQEILIKCPNQVVRSMFHRLIIHVITQVRPSLPLQVYVIGQQHNDDTCVTRFIYKMLAIISEGSRPHCKYLTEYFSMLYDFAKMGDNECMFMLRINAIAIMSNFFMSHKVESEEEEEESDDVIALTSETDEKYRPQSFEKMISLVALLVEKSRGEDNQLHLSQRDMQAIIGGKGLPFLYNQIRDNINIRHSFNLILNLCICNERLTKGIVQMMFSAITRLGVHSQPFFKVLSHMVEIPAGPTGMPMFIQYILHKFWEVAEYCPQQCLEWLATQVTRNKIAHHWAIQHLKLWVEHFLLAHQNLRVRNAAAYLLVALVPSNHFRQAFRSPRSILSPLKENVNINTDAIDVLHHIYTHLLELLGKARQYVDSQTQGTMKLVPYFALLNYCLISKQEKLMFSGYFLDLWQLFQPKLSEPNIALHHNKQALLTFWHQACLDCPENVRLIVTNPHVMKNIAFNYILADHEDQDVVLFNRSMLPAYYGILRMACQHSAHFTRQLAVHQNIHWAFKNITPYPTQYTAAVDELFKMMKLMMERPHPASVTSERPHTSAASTSSSTERAAGVNEEEQKAIVKFKRDNIQLYLQTLDARTSWQTLIQALNILLEDTSDRLLVLQMSGLNSLHEAFSTLHVMHHEATACHVATDIVDLLNIVCQILRTARSCVMDKKLCEVKPYLTAWKDHPEFTLKCLSLLNTYQPPEIRQASIGVLKELLLTYQNECLHTMVPTLVQAHTAFQEANMPIPVGPFFPKRGQKLFPPHKSNIRPSRPRFQMFLQSNMLEASRGVDEAYDCALDDLYYPYHSLVDLVLRVAINQQCVSEQVVHLNAMVAYEGVPLHTPYFAKLWYEIYTSEHVDKKCIAMLCNTSSLIDYMDGVLLDERTSLNNQHIYQFFLNYFPKVYQQVLSDQGENLIDTLMSSLVEDKLALAAATSDAQVHRLVYKISGDIKSMLLIFSVQQPRQLPPILRDSLSFIQVRCISQSSLRYHKSKETDDQVPPKRRRTSSEETSEDARAAGDAPCDTHVTDKQTDNESKESEDSVKSDEESKKSDETVEESGDVAKNSEESADITDENVEKTEESASSDKKNDDSTHKSDKTITDSEKKRDESRENSPDIRCQGDGPNVQGTSVKGASEKGVNVKDTSEKGASEKDTSEKGASVKGTSEKGASVKGASEKGANVKGTSEKGTSEKDTSEKGASEKGASEKDTSDKGASVKGTSVKGASEKGAGEKGAHLQGLNEKGTGEKGGGDRGTSGPSTSKGKESDGSKRRRDSAPGTPAPRKQNIYMNVAKNIELIFNMVRR